MAPTVATAAALMLMALQVSAAAADLPPPPAPRTIGQRGCDTSCGGVLVPYPFGFGPSHCYWPGLNLTCDTTHHPPRLLLGDGTLRVTNISLQDSTVRVVTRARSIINTTGGEFDDDGWNVSFGRGFTEHGYWLSDGNELVVSGCNLVATLVAGTRAKNRRIIAGCAVFCTSPFLDVVWPVKAQAARGSDGQGYCGTSTNNTSTTPCCQALLYDNTTNSPPTDEIVLQVKWLYCGNHAAEKAYAPMNVFVVEEGWTWINQSSSRWVPDANDELQEIN